MKNSVFIATSIDGYIADKQGKLDWLEIIPNPKNIDCGFKKFMDNIDAILMGRKTFEIVDGFDCEWPYSRPVFVLSNTLSSLPEKYHGKAEIVHGDIHDAINIIQNKNFEHLYIDGGKVIQSFLSHDLIDEMIITTIPILLGGGSPLFSHLNNHLAFRLKKSGVFLDNIVQNHFYRKT